MSYERSSQPALVSSPRLRATKLKIARGEAVFLNAGATQTLIDIDGPGILETLWLAVSDVSGGNDIAVLSDSHLKVYYDGSSSPAIDTDLATLFAFAFFDNNNTSGAYGTKHVHTETSLGTPRHFAGLLRFPMPFGNHIKITITNAGASDQMLLYWQGHHTLAETRPYRLYGSCRQMAGSAEILTTDEPVMASLTGSGHLVWHSMAGMSLSAPAGPSWLERNVEITIDGEGSPSLVSTGLEDWFDSGWYWGGRNNFGWYSGMAGPVKASGAPYNASAGIDLLAKFGGIPFNTSLVMKLKTEGAVTAKHYMSWVVLYYA
jgi:hypothetical protein